MEVKAMSPFKGLSGRTLFCPIPFTKASQRANLDLKDWGNIFYLLIVMGGMVRGAHSMETVIAAIFGT